MNFRIWTIISLLFLVAACGTDEFSDESYPEPHAESSDFVVVEAFGKADEMTSSFNRNNVVSDAFFEDVNAVGPDQVQAFLEDSPYGRSWLASERINGVRAADLIVSAARAENINPMMLLIRLQVEQTLVSPSSRPSQYRVDRALGCGCFDGQSCFSQYLGFANQMACGARTHRKLFDASVNGGDWAKGRTKRSLDRYSVTPSNHASAALYAYTPWVLPNRGGNWLAWNVARKFHRHMLAQDLYDDSPRPWIGTACTQDSDCGFSGSGQNGFCSDFVDGAGATRGFCTIMCEGYCPDRDGHATTFCIEGEPGLGLCAAKAEEMNTFCRAIPGTTETERERFIGDSRASSATSAVCVP
ncbi:MAG: hypothetical protein R3E66_01615 [bacterium]